MERLTRRTFVAASTAAIVPSMLLGTCVPAADGGTRSSPRTAYFFFTAEEAAFVEAACARLVASGADSFDAIGIRIAAYVDRHLASPWGTGAAPYRSGPWQPGTATSGQPALSPGSMFRGALKSISCHFRAQQVRFAELDPEQQRAFLAALAAGARLLDGTTWPVFFEHLLSMTVEGFISDPRPSQDRGLIGWPLKGFPGGYLRRSDAPAVRGATNPAATSHSQR